MSLRWMSTWLSPRFPPTVIGGVLSGRHWSRDDQSRVGCRLPYDSPCLFQLLKTRCSRAQCQHVRTLQRDDVANGTYRLKCVGCAVSTSGVDPWYTRFCGVSLCDLTNDETSFFTNYTHRFSGTDGVWATLLGLSDHHGSDYVIPRSKACSNEDSGRRNSTRPQRYRSHHAPNRSNSVSSIA